MSDPNSVANSEHIKIQHYSFHWTPHFDNSIISGKVNISCVILQSTGFINLDVRDLEISSANITEPLKQKLDFNIKDLTKLGWNLEISLPTMEVGQKFVLCIEYQTKPQGEAHNG